MRLNRASSAWASCVDHHRLGNAGNAFQQHVAVAEHGDQHLLQRVALADDHLANRFQDGIEFVGDRVLHEQTHRAAETSIGLKSAIVPLRQ